MGVQWYVIYVLLCIIGSTISFNCIRSTAIVALTRYHEIWEPSRQKLIAPMADMLNHSSEPNCEIIVEEGNVYVQTLFDIPAGKSLTVSYDDRK